jgi:hypothetical protein
MNNSFKTLHIFNDPKFSIDYFKFLTKHNVNLEQHTLFHYRCNRDSYPSFHIKSEYSNSFASLLPNLTLLKLLFQADKIVIHCLAAPALLLYLSVFPSLIKKCFWVIWGKDLYFYKYTENKNLSHHIYELFRKRVIPKIKHIVTGNEGDYKLAKQWYDVDSTLYKTFSYPSNLYIEYEKKASKPDQTLNILLGNSADPSNNHFDLLLQLEQFKDHDIKIIAPLSYGDNDHAKKVIKQGKKVFGDKFKALTNLLPKDQYIELAQTIDIGLFGHHRQQAMGNIIMLLSMGKKVYMHEHMSISEYLKNQNIIIYDIKNISLEINHEETHKNPATIKSIYTESALLEQWQTIFSARP